jgi:hypothetical protein
MSKLGFFNRFVFQLFFIRLAKNQENKVKTMKIVSYDLMSDGSISSRGYGNTELWQWYSIMYWVKPFTGWSSDYVYLTKDKKVKYYKLTKEIKIE